MILLAVSVSVAIAGDFELGRCRIGSGGDTPCTGGDFELSGTIGQPDAGYMSGGDFELTGGFWKPAGRGPEFNGVTQPDARQPLDEDYSAAEEQPLPSP